MTGWNKRKKDALDDVLQNIRLLNKEKRLQQNWLKLILDSGNQILEMIENSLDIFKMEENTYVFEPSPCNLTVIFQKLSNDLDMQIRQKNILLQLFIDDHPMTSDKKFWISGEFRLLQNLFANLLKNAIEASPQNESVRVYLNHQDKMSLIRINNKGVVPEVLRDRFFDRYATHGKKTGTGLGTYSAKLITKTHQGKIWFETNDISGTTLFVALPYSPEPEICDELLDDHLATNHKTYALQGNILVAEDNPINQQVIKGMMEDHIVNLDFVENGQQAVKAIQNKTYDVVLMDMEMPVMDGREAIKIIRQNLSFEELPIISLTAHEMNLSDVNNDKRIINDIIPKPIPPDHFFETLKKYLQFVPVDSVQKRMVPEKKLSSNDILNVDRALNQLMGKRHLLENIMQSFKKEHFNAPDAIKNLIENKQFKSAQRKIHTIKGLAGTIGATVLQNTAQELENAITSRMLPKVNQLITSFKQNLEPVIETIEKTLPVQTKESEDPSLSIRLENQLTFLEKNLDHFYHLLLDSDSEANDACEDCFPALNYLTQNTEDNQLLEQLKHYMKNYLFEDAAEILNTLAQKLGLELQTH